MIDSLQNVVNKIQHRAKEKEIGFGTVECKSENMTIIVSKLKII